MKTLVLLLFLLVLTTNKTTAQSIKFTMDFDTVYMPKYDYRKMASSENIQLRMPYGSHKFLRSSETKKITGATIYEIKLIVTDYPKGEDFTTLNNKRLAALYLLDPTLFNNPLTKWTIVYQTACTKEDVYHYFHGFEIVYRPLIGAINIEAQRTLLRNIMLGKSTLRDSTILKVMERNDWKKMAIVGDFTGSMSPYIGQLLLWYNLVVDREQSDIDGFVFFNDGNRTPDSEKKIGKTGGIYSTAQSNIDSVLETAITTIGNGSGGDAPENDIEALLMTQNKLFKDSEHYILIADNYASMRDIKLIKKLKKPVKIILCGAPKKINTEYINLAYQTKGSVHTIEEDIQDILLEIKEGEIIEINHQKFKLKDGKFVLQTPKKT